MAVFLPGAVESDNAVLNPDWVSPGNAIDADQASFSSVELGFNSGLFLSRRLSASDWGVSNLDPSISRTLVIGVSIRGVGNAASNRRGGVQVAWAVSASAPVYSSSVDPVFRRDLGPFVFSTFDTGMDASFLLPSSVTAADIDGTSPGGVILRVSFLPYLEAASNDFTVTCEAEYVHIVTPEGVGPGFPRTFGILL